NNLSDDELMKKHNLSRRGLKTLYKKLLAKGLEFPRAIERRIGAQRTDLSLVLENQDAKRVTINASAVLNSLSNGMTDAELMSNYRLSPRGLQSLYTKLYNRGLISKSTFMQRKASSEKNSDLD
ncbi:MAG TPA: hypothetical protein VMC85_25405, partial [Desulfomonilaceae bacterium]|nr:hypothetical protein [Desulfomonilaceae bacterium]